MPLGMDVTFDACFVSSAAVWVMVMVTHYNEFVCSAKPDLIIIEYMQNGDLENYLKRNRSVIITSSAVGSLQSGLTCPSLLLWYGAGCGVRLCDQSSVQNSSFRKES